jgi:hypothetical protein
MTTSLWKKLPTHWPTNGVTVWIRLVGIFEPFQAHLDNTTWTFITTAGYTVPWYVVQAWRPL